MAGHVSCYCHPSAAGLPAFRIPRHSVRDASTAFATRCPPGVGTGGRVAAERHPRTSKPRRVTRGHFDGRASAAYETYSGKTYRDAPHTLR